MSGIQAPRLHTEEPRYHKKRVCVNVEKTSEGCKQETGMLFGNPEKNGYIREEKRFATSTITHEKPKDPQHMAADGSK